MAPDMSLTLTQSGMWKRNMEPIRGPVPVTVCSRLLGGATTLFDEISEKLSITNDLKVCFPESWEQILSISYSLVMENRNSLSRFPHWAARHTHPLGTDTLSQRTSELFGSIQEDAKQHFFRSTRSSWSWNVASTAKATLTSYFASIISF